MSEVKLIKYEAARVALAEARRVDEVKSIRDKAMMFQTYAKQAKDRRLIEDAIDIRMRAEIKAGELLAKMEKHTGGRPSKTGDAAAPVSVPKLEEVGVTKKQSSQWQKLASLPPEEQDEKIEKAKRKASNALDGTAKRTREEMRADDEVRVRQLVVSKNKFRTLIVDPPWDYEWLSIAARATPGYATMQHHELMALDVEQWAEKNAHIYLWTTNNFITRASELMTHWGFNHKTVLTWRKLSKNGKPWWGLGSYFRNATEHVLFGVRGELRTRVDDVSTYFEAPIGEHSEKPDVFYDLVKRASFEPYGEVFQREPRPGFTNVFESIVQEAAE